MYMRIDLYKYVHIVYIYQYTCTYDRSKTTEGEGTYTISTNIPSYSPWKCYIFIYVGNLYHVDPTYLMGDRQIQVGETTSLVQLRSWLTSVDTHGGCIISWKCWSNISYIKPYAHQMERIRGVTIKKHQDVKTPTLDVVAKTHVCGGDRATKHKPTTISQLDMSRLKLQYLVSCKQRQWQKLKLEIGWNGCFLKWWYPQNTPKWSFLVGKPWLLGTTIFGNTQMAFILSRTTPMMCLEINMPKNTLNKQLHHTSNSRMIQGFPYVSFVNSWTHAPV